MAEKTETPKPDKEKKEKPAEPKKTEAPAPAAEKSEKESGSKSHKINKMTLAEVEAKLEDIKGKQGGLRSKYALQLLHKKSLLKG
jgi:ribosomal protein L29